MSAVIDKFPRKNSDWKGPETFAPSHDGTKGPHLLSHLKQLKNQAKYIKRSSDIGKQAVKGNDS